VVEIVDFLKDPGKSRNLRRYRGCVMVGSREPARPCWHGPSPGEAKVRFSRISGSDFVEMFVGVGASRVRDMFEQAKKARPLHHFHR